MAYFITAHLVFMVFTLIGLPCYILWRNKWDKTAHPLGLPKGSVRSLLAISVIGSFLITMALGPLFIAHNTLSIVIAGLTGIVGSIIGFYFGSRSVELKKIDKF